MWAMLIKKWHGKIYHVPNKRVVERYNFIKRNAKLLTGDHVLDLGCNAALFAVPIMKYADYYIGIESEEKYYRQADITQKYVKNVLIVKEDIDAVDFTNVYCSALIASRILYYLSDKTIERIRKQLLPKCRTVLLINGMRPKKKKCNSWDFWKPSAGTKFLEGFDGKLEIGHEKASYRIVATK